MVRAFPQLRSRFSVPAVLMLAACLGTAVAQEQQAPNGPQVRVRQGPPGGNQAEADRPLVSVEFRGGSVAEFVEAVKGASSVPVNVVGPVEVMKMPVPAVSLRNVTPFMALQTLEYVNERRPSAAGLQVMDLNRSEANNSRSQTFAISPGRTLPFVPGGQAPLVGPGPEAPTTQVYAVRDLLGGEASGGLPGLSMDQIVEPLEAALNVDAGDGTAEPAKLMVHKASNLILVRGTQKQNALVRQVLDRLRDDTQATRASAGRERERVRIAEELKQQFQVREQMLQAQAADQEKRLEEMRAVIAKARKDGQEEQAVLTLNSVREAEERLAMVQNQLVQSKMQQAEIPIEAARQARNISGALGSETLAQLRAEIEGLRRQLEELRAGRSGTK